MNLKSLTISLMIATATAAGASAQSLLDLQDLFGRQSQVRGQDSAVKVEYDIDFHYFFDYRSFGASDDIFLESGTINVARFSPSAVLRFDQGRDITHRLALGVDLTKNLGANPTASIDFSTDENDPALRNTGLIKDIFFYYNYPRRIGSGRLGFYAGIHPRTVLEGSYTRAIFADDLIYYDPNIEGVTVAYSSPRLKAELTFDMVANRGYDRKGDGMVSRCIQAAGLDRSRMVGRLHPRKRIAPHSFQRRLRPGQSIRQAGFQQEDRASGALRQRRSHRFLPDRPQDRRRDSPLPHWSRSRDRRTQLEHRCRGYILLR